MQPTSSNDLGGLVLVCNLAHGQRTLHTPEIGEDIQGARIDRRIDTV